MACFIRCLVILFLFWGLVDGISLSDSEHRNYVRLFGRSLRSKREISATIKNCQHWKIAHSDDPDVTDVVVSLHNSAKTAKKMSSALQCHTMRKLQEPKLKYKVAAGATKEILFSIAVSPAHYHHDSSVRTHQCLLSTWNNDPNSYVTCKITLSVWPNGLFYYNCSSYEIGQLFIEEYSNHLGTHIGIQNTGPKSLYLVNSTCTPTIMTLTHTNKYKRLSKGEDWTLDFPASCDGRIGINYKGLCDVKVFHVCLKTTTLIKQIRFDFIDGIINLRKQTFFRSAYTRKINYSGEIEECEHRKSKYSAYRRHWLVSLVGLNSFATSALVPVIVILTMAILLTLALKFILSAYQYGSVYKAKRELQARFRALFSSQSENNETSGASTLNSIGSKR